MDASPAETSNACFSRLFAIFTRDSSNPRRDLCCEAIENETNTRVQLTYTYDGSKFPHIDPQVAPVLLSDQAGILAFTTGPELRCDVTLGSIAAHSVGPDSSDILADRLVLYVQSIPVASDWMIEIRTADGGGDTHVACSHALQRSPR